MTEKTKTLILDFSPILYSNFISASMEMQRNGLKPNANKKLDISTPGYKEIINYKIMSELSSLKTQFKVDEIVIACDNPTGGYWRKDVYPIYKGGRKEKREESELQWDKAFAVFDEIKNVIEENTSFKLINLPKTEGDDVMFVLSKYLSLQGQEVILHSLDHDTVYSLKGNFNNSNTPGIVKWWRHVKTAKKPGAFQSYEAGEILLLEIEHLVQGDASDNIKNIKSYSRFSKKFKELYPDKKEIDVYDKRFELDEMFEEKYGCSAYDHPRYGAKMFLKSKKTIEELLKENPIYELNYKMNSIIAMPEGIPADISKSIIEKYNSAETTRNISALQEYFMKNGCFELIGSLMSF